MKPFYAIQAQMPDGEWRHVSLSTDRATALEDVSYRRASGIVELQHWHIDGGGKMVLKEVKAVKVSRWRIRRIT